MKKIYLLILFLFTQIQASELSQELTFSQHLDNIEKYLSQSTEKNSSFNVAVSSLLNIAHHTVLKNKCNDSFLEYQRFQSLPFQNLITIMESKNIASGIIFSECPQSLLNLYPFMKTITQLTFIQTQLVLHNPHIIFTEKQQALPFYSDLYNYFKNYEYDFEFLKKYSLFFGNYILTINNFREKECLNLCELIKAGLVQLYINTEKSKTNPLELPLVLPLCSLTSETPTNPLINNDLPANTELKISSNNNKTQNFTQEPTTTSTDKENTNISHENIETKNTRKYFYRGGNNSFKTEEQVRNGDSDTANETSLKISDEEESRIEKVTPQKKSLIKPLITLCILYIIIKYCYPHTYEQTTAFLAQQLASLYSHP